MPLDHSHNAASIVRTFTQSRLASLAFFALFVGHGSGDHPFYCSFGRRLKKVDVVIWPVTDLPTDSIQSVLNFLKHVAHRTALVFIKNVESGSDKALHMISVPLEGLS